MMKHKTILTSLTRSSYVLVSFLGLLFSVATHATIINGNVSTVGSNFISIADPSGLTVGDDNFQDNHVRAFDEDQNVILDSNITAYTSWNWSNQTVSGTSGVGLSIGEQVASHYVMFDPLAGFSVNGWMEFDSDVLGIIVDTNTLSLTDSLINNSVTYLNPGLRGLEDYQDWIRIDPSSSNRIEFHLSASTPGDYFRVLTAYSPGATVPEPSSLLLMSLGLFGLFSRRFKKT